MLVGYARTSTLDQDAGLEAQIRDLKEFGCEQLFSEQVSSVGDRAKLDLALQTLRKDDKLVVTKLDRLARSTKHLGELIDFLDGKKVGLVILSMGGQQMDTSTATGKLMLNVMSSVAQFEREMMLERQREGIEKAKAAGKFRGRKPTAREKLPAIEKLIASGMAKDEVAKALGIHRSSVYRLLGDA